ncbi:MAG: cobalamin B12-binding domain protein [Herbinix sp.]|nr:cobalamin B12-binding domain protein [Herbinix sp.]
MYNFVFVIFDTKKEGISSWVNISYLYTAIKDIPDLKVSVAKYSLDEINKAINEIGDLQANIIGLPMLQINHMICLEFARAMKRNNKNIKIVLGNIDATLYYKYIMENNPFIDVIIKGEGEQTLNELSHSIINNINLGTCKGIIYREDSLIFETPDRETQKDIDLIGIPNRSFIKDKKVNRYAIIGSRGCIGSCTFCNANSINHKKSLRIRSIDNVLEEIGILYSEYNCKFIEFVDAVFLGGSYKYINEFYEKLREKDYHISFNINLTCELINEKMIDLLNKLKKVGLEFIYLGIEAGNKYDLKLYNKRASLDDNIRAVTLLNQNKFYFMYGFINFNPYSSLDTLRQNINFIEKTDLLVDMSIISRTLWIFGGTVLLKKLIEDGLTNQKIDEPIYDVENYKYQDENVSKVKDAVKYISNYFGSEHDPLTYLLTYERHKTFYGENLMVYNQLQEYAQYVSKSHIDLFKRLISLADENSQDYLEPIRYMIDDVKMEMHNRIKELKPKITKMYMSLYKINQVNID